MMECKNCEQLLARIKELERKLEDAESCVDDYHADIIESANKHSRKILEPPADPIQDGNYLFREESDSWWRATTVKKGIATGKWIVNKIRIKHIYQEGEWHGPLADDNPEWVEANQDSMGRLLRKFEPVSADPWLGVWRHKESGKKIEVIEGIQTIQLVKWRRSSGIEASMDINFLLANFEKVTEAE